MDYVRTQMVNIQELYKKLFLQTNTELSHLPEVRFLISMSNGNMSFHMGQIVNGEYKRKGIKKNQELVRKLARKEFLTSELKLLQNNINQIEKTINQSKDIDPNSIIATMRKGYQKLPPEYFFNQTKFAIDHKLKGEEKLRMQRHVEWANTPYRVNNAYPDEKNKLTSFGLSVRSKSEQLIAEKLHDYGVPFRYDALYTYAGEEISPDFTFQDRNMNLFFWEHAGQMDKPRYEQRHNRKMTIYRSVNIVPWDNLIVTYEYENVINMGIVKAIIENVVIPRL